MDGYGKRVLVVDDDHHARLLMGAMLDYAGYNVVPAADAFDALRELDRRHFDVVVTDYRIPGPDGIGLLQRLRTQHPDLPVILVSGQLPDSAAPIECRPFAAIRKPFDKDRLLAAVRSAAHWPVTQTNGIATEGLR